MRNEDNDIEMSKKHYAQGSEEFVHKNHNGSRNQRYTRTSRNLTWRRDPLAGDRTTRFPVAVHPTASSDVTNLVGGHPYRFGGHDYPQYYSQPVYPDNVYGVYGVPSYGYGNHVYPSHGVGARNPHGFRDRQPPSYGPSVYYPPSSGSTARYPVHGSGASGPSTYDFRGRDHLSYSHGTPSLGKGVHDFPQYETGAIVPSPNFPAVCLRGLPKNCRDIDIIRFFDGLDIVDVLLVFINKIFSRKAFVVFSSAIVADSALRRDKQMGYESVEICECRRHDYYDAVAAAVNDGDNFGNPLEIKENNVVNDVNYHEGSQGLAMRFKDSSVVGHTRKRNSEPVADSRLHRHSDARPENLAEEDQRKPTRHILKLRSPCVIDKKVILGVFGDCNLCEDRVHSVLNPEGKPTGEMLLEFICLEDSVKAMSKDKTVIESHHIELFPCLEELRTENIKQLQERDFQDRVNDSDDKQLVGADAQSHGKAGSYNNNQQNVYTQFLKLSRVPPSADMYDIIDFFGEFNLTLDRLHVFCRRDGIATGEVYVEFDSVEDARKAISKDKNMILSQCVELFPSSPNKARRAMSMSW